ncbi:hypothetical protein FF1_009089 [Malus domestica]
MGNADLKLDAFTLSSVIPVFAEYVDVIKGKEICGYAIRRGLDADVFIGSSLIDMLESTRRKKAIDHVPPVRKLKKSEMLGEGQGIIETLTVKVED